jgi:hypothetical protein
MSEIDDMRSEKMLITALLDEDRETEIRAGAAWGLGRFSSLEAVDALIRSFQFVDREIRTEAARALLSVAPRRMEDVLKHFIGSEPPSRDGIAWAMARVGQFDPVSLLDGEPDLNLRRWLAYIVGNRKESFDNVQMETLQEKDRDVFFAATVLWQIAESWTYKLTEY